MQPGLILIAAERRLTRHSLRSTPAARRTAISFQFTCLIGADLASTKTAGLARCSMLAVVLTVVLMLGCCRQAMKGWHLAHGLHCKT